MDVNGFAKSLTETYAVGFKALGRERAFNVLFKFFARRAFRNMEEKAGGPIEDEEARTEAIEHLEEELKTALDSIDETYFDTESEGEEVA